MYHIAALHVYITRCVKRKNASSYVKYRNWFCSQAKLSCSPVKYCYIYVGYKSIDFSANIDSSLFAKLRHLIVWVPVAKSWLIFGHPPLALTDNNSSDHMHFKYMKDEYTISPKQTLYLFSFKKKTQPVGKIPGSSDGIPRYVRTNWCNCFSTP